jgi:hypothetical protein
MFRIPPQLPQGSLMLTILWFSPNLLHKHQRGSRDRR